MNFHPLYQRVHQVGAVALVALCLFQIGCRRESGSAAKSPESSPAEKVAEAKPFFFDFGTTNSALAEGFTAVTPESVSSP